MHGYRIEQYGQKVESEVAIPIIYRGQRVHEEGFRLDLLVEDRVIVELKSVDKVQDVHKKQQLLLAPCSLKLLHWGPICDWQRNRSVY